MKLAKDTTTLKQIISQKKAAGKTIGLVPTMGYLHKGHLSLVQAAKKKADFVVVSIFVNSIQFGPKEDLSSYPKNLKRDKTILKKQGVDLVFVPSVEQVYPKNFSNYIEVPGLSNKLCGKSRPGHFKGVATVVARLFDLVKPDLAFFGKKDFQQQVIIRKMVKDLGLPVKIISLPTVREKDGLAMSSRNKYLTEQELKIASILHKNLKTAKKAIALGKIKKAQAVIKLIRQNILKTKKIKIDYISVVDPETLENVKTLKKGADILIALAVYLGKARLIDNIEVKI